MNRLLCFTSPLEAGQRLRAGPVQRQPAPGKDAWRVPVFVVVLCYLVLPGLLSLLAVWLLDAQPHGYINLEFLLIGAVAIFLPRWAVFCLLLFDSLADCAYSICYTYQFSVSDLVESARFLKVLPWRRLAAGCGVAAVAVLACYALSLVRPHPRRRVRATIALWTLAMVLLPVDMLSGQNPLWRQDLSLLPGRVARSPVLTLGVRGFFASRTEQRARRAGNKPMDSASAQMMALLDGHAAGEERPNVVLVVVESWGLPLDAHLAQALTAPYASPEIAGRYRVRYGTAPYTGLTVPGEARELCHSTMGFGILHPSREVAKRCLPGRFHALGYENVAIHGYAGAMFYRALWYPALGFDRAWFGPELQRNGLPLCGGAFPGICDGAIAGFIGEVLLGRPSPRPRFIYWVTLNSHLPVPARPSLPADNTCAAHAALSNSEALCSWFRLVRQVHESVSRIATQSAARPTVFLLVGDHAPPFADPRLRSRFSDSRVPYVMLTPLSLALR